MKILSIETSCDETAISIIDAKGSILKPKFKVLGNSLYSQVALHAQYGGVMPNLAKREHGRNLIPLLEKSLREARLLKVQKIKYLGVGHPSTKPTIQMVQKILNRESELLEQFLVFIPTIQIPKIDAIAVTFGPGLEPALWVGISFAEALGKAWNLPVVPVNHMEGHVVSPMFDSKSPLSYPAIALLISGGHTELVHIKTPLSYKTIGKTRDDALGEAYDKVARMLGLPYPGGPEVSKLASEKRESGYTKIKWSLPRPMLYTKDFDFSFSGLKTSVLYKIRDHKKLTQGDRAELAKEFEDAVTDVIITKTSNAIEKFNPKSLVIGGGVIANPHIRKAFQVLAKEKKISLHIPEFKLATDNSIMIGMAGYLRIIKSPSILKSKKRITAEGNAFLV